MQSAFAGCPQAGKKPSGGGAEAARPPGTKTGERRGGSRAPKVSGNCSVKTHRITVYLFWSNCHGPYQNQLFRQRWSRSVFPAAGSQGFCLEIHRGGPVWRFDSGRGFLFSVLIQPAPAFSGAFPYSTRSTFRKIRRCSRAWFCSRPSRRAFCAWRV